MTIANLVKYTDHIIGAFTVEKVNGVQKKKFISNSKIRNIIKEDPEILEGYVSLADDGKTLVWDHDLITYDVYEVYRAHNGIVSNDNSVTLLNAMMDEPKEHFSIELLKPMSFASDIAGYVRDEYRNKLLTTKFNLYSWATWNIGQGTSSIANQLGLDVPTRKIVNLEGIEVEQAILTIPKGTVIKYLGVDSDYPEEAARENFESILTDYDDYSDRDISLEFNDAENGYIGYALFNFVFAIPFNGTHIITMAGMSDMLVRNKNNVQNMMKPIYGKTIIPDKKKLKLLGLI